MWVVAASHPISTDVAAVVSCVLSLIYLFDAGLLLRRFRRRLLQALQSALESVLERHVVLGTETQAGSHDVLDGLALREQRIDHGSPVGNQRSLEHVRQEREDGVESFPLGLALLLDGDALAELSEDHQVVDERRGQERVLAGVVHRNGVLSPHENLRRVLVHGALRVADVRNVLDDHHVVGVFVFLKEDAVRFHHVVDHVRLGNFLASELRGRAQVLPVVVSQVVVRDDRDGFDPGTDQEIDQDALHLGLSALEIVTGNKDLLLTGQVDDTGNKGVLRGTVDEGAALQNGGDRKNGGRADLGLVALDGVQDVFRGVVDSLLDARKALRVGGPQQDDLVEFVLGLEIRNVLSDLFHLLLLASTQDIVGTLALVGGNKVRKVDGRQRNNVLHVGVELLLEVVIQDLRSLHALRQVHFVNVPSAPDDLARVHHREHVFEGSKDGVAPGVVSELDRRGHHQRSPVVGLFLSLLCVPGNAEFVGQSTRDAGASIVSSETNQHDSDLWDFAFRLELHFGLHRNHHVPFDKCALILEVRDDGLVGVLALVRSDGKAPA
mmetsp:Transcript_21119/g.49874  ORF Transcript_21119/g.49874 Transcript_21119/m.49874 type:complete len:552 (-) Transcript_21119:169-1824(-)